MTERLLEKAWQALTTARRNLNEGDAHAAANRCYYAVFYAAWAMFVARGLDPPKSHSGLIAELGRRFVKDGPLDRSLGATLGKLENLRASTDRSMEFVNFTAEAFFRSYCAGRIPHFSAVRSRSPH